MKTNYHTDGGQYWSIEDLTQRIVFVIADLRKQNYSDIEIIEFEDNEMWQEMTSNIIMASNKEI